MADRDAVPPLAGHPEAFALLVALNNAQLPEGWPTKLEQADIEALREDLSELLDKLTRILSHPANRA